MGFTLVAIVITSVTMSAAWGVVHNLGVATVSLRDVAESDFIPLGAVALFRCTCALVAFYTMLCVYCDHEGLALYYRDAQVLPAPPQPLDNLHPLVLFPPFLLFCPRCVL